MSLGSSPFPWGPAAAGLPSAPSGGAVLRPGALGAIRTSLRATHGYHAALSLCRAPWCDQRRQRLHIALRGRLQCSPRCTGWLRSFLPLPVPCTSSPGTQLTLRVTPEVSSPQGKSSTIGVLVALGNTTPPPTPWRPPPGFSATLEVLPPPLILPLQRNCLPGFPAGRRPSPCPLFPPHAPPCYRCDCILGGCV